MMSNASRVYEAAVLMGIVVVTVQGVIFCFVVTFQCKNVIFS